MNKYFKFSVAILTIAIIAFSWQSCAVLKDVTNTLADIGKLKFKLDNVSNMSVSGIDFSNKKTFSDVTTSDVLKLTSAFATKKFPARFNLNVLAQNPNDGTAGTKKTNAIIQSLDYRLIIDDVSTITGDISGEITVPGSGQATMIPLGMELDLYKFFGNRGYESIVNLALAIGGLNGSPAKIKLDVKPTVRTAIGPMTYPGRLTVVDQEWR
ncbi:MAG: hypothetical protein KIT33_09250 [Candidatus Kapabacteria bacterium]|nr:hypothetical protein [Ignavibacteriota bacterium]MCW5885142.1 hypothetical protein [Candidatus Kapabacteria bacterium]